MNSYHNSKFSAPAMSANKTNEWAFQGNTSFDPVYEGNFDEDIDAIAGSIGDDSGYFSNDSESSKASNVEVTSSDHTSAPVDLEHSPSLPSDRFYADLPASNKSNHGSINDGVFNKSTTHLEKGNSINMRKETRMSKTLHHIVHDYEQKMPHIYSAIESGGPHPLEIWAKTAERHERIAYQLKEQLATPQPSMRRKTG